jgi:hypothetical protein
MNAILTLEDLAEYMLFGIIRTRDELEYRIHGRWEYRKGKDFEDVKQAFRKGMKMGKGEVKHEIEWIAYYLRSVLKSNEKCIVK